MSSNADYTNDETFRRNLRRHFMGQVKNPQFQTYLAEKFSGQRLKDQTLETTLNGRQTCGGDADRTLHYSPHVVHCGEDSWKMRNNDDSSLKYLPKNSKPSAPAVTSNDTASSRKYQTTNDVDNYIGDHHYFYESNLNLGGLGNCSEDSVKSQKSSKTVVSRKSSTNLRKLVTSQCKLHEVIGETLKEMCNTEPETAVKNVSGLQSESSSQHPAKMSPCKRCTDRLQPVQSRQNVVPEIGKGDSLDCRNINTLTISVDDVISSRVINPMIHKLHRMYLNNLKEEMSLMEDLERLPNRVNEVYKSIIFKQKE